MANRFTEDKKWTDAWFSKLTPSEKLLFMYMIDNCDLAGFIEIDVRMFSFMTGLSEEQVLGAVQGLNRGYLGANTENWIWIKNFIKYQKNLPINPENNAHKNIINCIISQRERFDLRKIEEHLGANQGLISPTGKGRVKVTKGVQGENGFEQFWEAYPKKKSKGDAEKAWKTINPSVELVEDIMRTIELLKKSEQWQKDKGQFIPFPASWLRAKGWLDEAKPNGSPKAISPSAYSQNPRTDL